MALASTMQIKSLQLNASTVTLTEISSSITPTSRIKVRMAKLSTRMVNVVAKARPSRLIISTHTLQTSPL